MSLLERFDSPGPKRILALDGGGIRGALTVGYLIEIERLLQTRHEDPSLLLCDYFDLIAGTSTGAIIASLLAVGKSASEIANLYEDLGGKIFEKKYSWWKPWQTDERTAAAFDSKPIELELRRILGDVKLGSDTPDVRTGLCIVTKRADSQSTWPLINHPRGKYFTHNAPIPLAVAVRASSAAPTYFVPEEIDVGGGEMGAFVDGGVSMFNNPALQALMVAWLDGFPLHWEQGEDRLLLVSVGTGYWSHKRERRKVLDAKLWDWAGAVPGMLMEDATWHNQLLLQWLSKSPTAREIDREVGDLRNDRLGDVSLLTYLRYDVELSKDGLAKLGLPLASRAEELREMSKADNRADLASIGVEAGKAHVKDEHFPVAFDLRGRA